MSYLNNPRHNRLLYESDHVQIGAFDCPRGDALFRDSGPADGCLVVFPRRAVGIEHPGREPLVAGRTMLTLYNPGQRYTRRPLSDYGDQCTWFRFDADRVRGALSRHGRPPPGDIDGPFVATHSSCDLATFLVQRRLLRRLSSGPCLADGTVERFARHLLAVTVRGIQRGAAPRAGRARTRKRHSTLARRCLELLATRYSEPLTLQSVAHGLATTPYHLARVFKRWTGVTLHQHLVDIRLRAAVDRLLDDPGQRITDLGLELGFATPSHFAQRFREGFGITPRAFATE